MKNLDDLKIIGAPEKRHSIDLLTPRWVFSEARARILVYDTGKHLYAWIYCITTPNRVTQYMIQAAVKGEGIVKILMVQEKKC